MRSQISRGLAALREQLIEEKVNAVPDNPRTGRDVIANADWDIPLTDTFVANVRGGVRRRQLLRAVAAGGAVLATAGVVVALNLGGGGTPVVGPGSTSPSAPASSAIGKPLDGFQIGYLPEGAVVSGADSVATYAVTEQGLRNDGPDPGPGEPRAAVATRTFTKGAGRWMWVAVLRPDPSVGSVDPAQLPQWLVEWETKGAQPLRTFDVPAGSARLVAHVANETTTHEIVITTNDNVVITISGAGTLTAEEQEKVARSITA